MAIQPDGRIVAVGSVVHSSATRGTQYRCGRRPLPDRRPLDPGFGAAGLLLSPSPPTTRAGGGTYGGAGQAYVVAIDGSGRVLVGGSAFSFGSVDMGLTRYTPTGAPDQSFGRAGWAKIDVEGRYDAVRALAIQPDGRAVFAGSSDSDSLLPIGRLPPSPGTPR